MKITSAELIKSVYPTDDFPSGSYPEVAFAGRSNVGKSSLINTLVNRKGLARTSAAPGKTQSINFYLVNNSFCLVDLPGYGYAKVSHSEKKRWQALIELYLESSKQLKILFTLIDSKVGVKANDLELLKYLHFHNINFEIILTKSDKIGSHVKTERVNEILKALNWKSPRKLHLFSSKKRSGMESVLYAIERDLKIK